VAYVKANDALRAISVSGQATRDGVADAMRGSGLYIARERLLATGIAERLRQPGNPPGNVA
jgi:hypothetical protein